MTPAQLPPRTLRCANGALYLLMGLAVAGCAAWAIGSGRVAGAWHTCAALAGAALALLWGGSYTLLRWEIGPAGITHRSILRRRCYPWANLQNAQIQQSEQNGVATCCLQFNFSNGALELSSQLIALDELEQLSEDLAAAGLLPQNAKKTCSE